MRRQKTIVIVMILALVTVLIALGALIQRSGTTSPVATVAVFISKTPAAQPTVRPRGSATASSNSSTRPTPTPSQPEVAAQVLAARRIEKAGRDVGRIRELPKQQEIPLNFLSAQEIASYLRHMLADSERREKVGFEQALLAALDLSPQPGEAFPTSVQTRARHLIAFYDATDAQIFVGPAAVENGVPDYSLVHQYAHALIDQHFGLLSFSQGARNADAGRARDALVEGDAMAVLALNDYGNIDQADLDELADHVAQAELTDYEGYLNARALRQVHASPYVDGTRFVAALLSTGWWPAVNAAYLDPPDSTEQILHPEKYIDSPRDLPRTAELLDLSGELDAGWQLVGKEVLGELILRAHLDQYLASTPEAQEAAAGWDGDVAVLWQNADGGEVLLIRTLWDNSVEAAEFTRSYATLVDTRLRGASRVVRPILPRSGRWWRSDVGNAYLQQDDDDVLIIWAPDTETMERVLAVLVFERE